MRNNTIHLKQYIVDINSSLGFLLRRFQKHLNHVYFRWQEYKDRAGAWILTILLCLFRYGCPSPLPIKRMEDQFIRGLVFGCPLYQIDDICIDPIKQLTLQLLDLMDDPWSLFIPVKGEWNIGKLTFRLSPVHIDNNIA